MVVLSFTLYEFCLFLGIFLALLIFSGEKMTRKADPLSDQVTAIKPFVA